jgi:hypothetical protein
MHWDKEVVEIQLPITDGLSVGLLAHEAVHAAEYMVQDFEWTTDDVDNWRPAWALETRAEQIEETKCWVTERIVNAVVAYALNNGITVDAYSRTDATGRAC